MLHRLSVSAACLAALLAVAPHTFAQQIATPPGTMPGPGGKSIRIIGLPDVGPAKPPPGVPQLPYSYGPRVKAPFGEKFGQVAAVAFRPNGNLLVLSRNPTVMLVEYDPTGTRFIRSINPGIAVNPHGLRVDRHGNIWVIDSFMNVIWKLNPQGEVIRMFGVRGENATWDDAKWNGMFDQPMDIAFDAQDNFYVVQSHGGASPPADCSLCATYEWVRNPGGKAVGAHPPVSPGLDPRVMKFDKDGRLLASVSLARSGDAPVIHTVLVSPKGEVWVTDRAEKKIVVFDGDLQRRREITGDYLTCGFYQDARGDLWMTAGRDGLVFKMDWDGKILGWFGQRGVRLDTDDIGEAHYMAVSADQKTIFIADSSLGNVHKLERR